jgi:hypothetical protein
MPNKIIGFVYLWLDSGRHSESHPGRRMFCLGSHYGTEDDGYITGTGGKRFKASYRKRKQDFRRRIIERIYKGNGRDVLNAEQRWLDMIKPEELNYRYYNQKKTAFGLTREDMLRLHDKLIAGQQAAYKADPTIITRRGATWSALHKSDPTLGPRISKGVKAAHKADPTLGHRMGAAISVAVSNAYKADPTNRKRAGITRSNTYKTNPEFGLRMSASQRATHDADPQLGWRKSAGMRTAQANRTPEQRSKISLKAARTYRAHQNEVITTFALWLFLLEYYRSQ